MFSRLYKHFSESPTGVPALLPAIINVAKSMRIRVAVAGATYVGWVTRILKCKFSSQPQVGGNGVACEGKVAHAQAFMVGGSPAEAALLIGLPMERIHDLDPFRL